MMAHLIAVNGANVATMSSRDLAELIEKQHSHIKISAERLADRGIIGTLATREFAHNGNLYTEYLFNKRDSHILVAQNCPEFTARIVDRWQALEEFVARPDPTAILSDPASLRKLLLDYTETVIALEGKVAEQNTVLALQAPKVEALDVLATRTDGSVCITNAAKDLQVPPRRLFSWLQEHDWIYRRAGGSGYVAYQRHIKTGNLEHKVAMVERLDGSAKMVEQVLVTAKGLAKLAIELSGQFGLKVGT